MSSRTPVTFISLLLFFALSCNERKEPKHELNKTTLINVTVNKFDSSNEKKFRPIRYQFIADSILHGHDDILRFYFSKYASDTCSPSLYDSTFFRNSEGIGYIGNINHNKLKDSFFILYPISSCQFSGEDSWDGEAYYFIDTTLPRLQTESYCCHPSSLFRVGDIDEDGTAEIGQFYSSCSSRYKSLYVYSLKNKRWKEVGHVIYDLFYADSTKPYSAYVRKTKAKEFEMLEITDLSDRKFIGKRHWRKFKIGE
jgi:hypothetical protein